MVMSQFLSINVTHVFSLFETASAKFPPFNLLSLRCPAVILLLKSSHYVARRESPPHMLYRFWATSKTLAQNRCSIDELAVPVSTENSSTNPQLKQTADFVVCWIWRLKWDGQIAFGAPINNRHKLSLSAKKWIGHFPQTSKFDANHHHKNSIINKRDKGFEPPVSR